MNRKVLGRISVDGFRNRGVKDSAGLILLTFRIIPFGGGVTVAQRILVPFVGVRIPAPKFLSHLILKDWLEWFQPAKISSF